jgi:hypothetical protein
MARSIDFKLFGRWDIAIKNFNRLPHDLKQECLRAQRSIAEKYFRIVRGHLKNQDIPGWTPLNERYLARKIEKGQATEMLIRDYYYLQSIKVWRKDNIYHVGVPKQLTYPNGKSISRIAAIHENKSLVSDQPYRPLWRPSFEELKGTNMKNVKALVIQQMVKNLRNKGHNIKTIKF